MSSGMCEPSPAVWPDYEIRGRHRNTLVPIFGLIGLTPTQEYDVVTATHPIALSLRYRMGPTSLGFSYHIIEILNITYLIKWER
jgi:hypothetical protein